MEIILEYVPKDKDNFMGDLECFGYVNSIEEYLKFALIANVGNANGNRGYTSSKKMFGDATLEQILIDIDLMFEGDTSELTHIL